MTVRARPRSSRWFQGALILSLAVNAFFIGAVATDYLRPPRQKVRPVSFELRWLEGRLPEAEFNRVAEAIAAARPSAEGYLSRLRELRNDLGILVAAPAPDRAAVDAKLAEIRGELDRMVMETQNAATSALLALPPESRARLGTER